MLNSGKLALAVMLLLAVALATFAVWFRHRATHRSLDYWTPGAAQLILHAPQVELLELAPPAEAAGEFERVVASDRHWAVVAKQDLSQAQGLVHVRHALLDDLSYDWAPRRDACVPRWTHAMRFADQGRETLILFDFACARARLIGRTDSISIRPIRAGLEEFFDEQTPADQPDGQTPPTL